MSNSWNNLFLKRRDDQRVQGAQRGDKAPKANLPTWRKDRERQKMRLLLRKLIRNSWSQKHLALGWRSDQMLAISWQRLKSPGDQDLRQVGRHLNAESGTTTSPEDNWIEGQKIKIQMHEKHHDIWTPNCETILFCVLVLKATVISHTL